ncbi:putative reverse transcriptase domain-containing protein [Tanacetum coccineum]
MRANHGPGFLFRPRIDARVVVEAVDREEIEASARGPVEVRVDRVTHPVIAADIPEPAQDGAAEVTYETLGDLVQRFHDHTVAILVHHVQAIESIQREQGHRIMATGQKSADTKMRNTQFGASRTREGVNEQIDRRLAGALGARGTARNLERLIRDEGEHEEKSHKRTVGIEAAYVMSWAELMKLITEVYCPRNEEWVFLCTKMVPNEEDKVERFVGGLPDNIQVNVIVAERTRLQDAIRIANNLMDQKLKGYASSAENKRRLENNPRDNHGQQPIFKRYGNCKRVGHMIKDCKVTVTPNTQRAPIGNQLSIICYECGRPGYFRKDCPKLKNQNRRNKTGNKNGNKTENQTGGNEATKGAYAIRGGGENLDSNVVTGTFLLNSCYASMLFDSGAGRSFVSSTFSALLDVT